VPQERLPQVAALREVLQDQSAGLSLGGPAGASGRSISAVVVIVFSYS
jgi:hypothetical protein